jgi:hypothetical protein
MASSDTGNPPNVVLGGGLGGFGTLGCLARTGGANPKVVAITNQHVVGSNGRGQPNTLTLDSTQTFGGTNTPGTVVTFGLKIGASSYHAFYQTGDSDTLDSIAQAIASRIDSGTPAGVNATASGSQVQIQGAVNKPDLWKIFSAPTKNTWADFRTRVQGNVISASGRASRACAAYVNVNTGGLLPTRGVFVPIKRGDGGQAVINSISTAINNANIPTPNSMLVSTTVNLLAVIFDGTQEIECELSNDVQVGQPTNTMTVFPVLDDQIGVVLDAHVDVDVALIKLDAGLTYRADILEIDGGQPGAVTGIHDIHLENPGYPLKKRGVRKGLTSGILQSLDNHGYTSETDRNGNEIFGSYYTGAFVIAGTDFAMPGDSGSAVLNNDNEVVGILFSSTHTQAMATPIQAVLDSFAALNLTIETAGVPGIDKMVP